MSPTDIEAWIGVVTAGGALVAVSLRFTRKAFRAFDRLEAAVQLVEGRSVQLEHNGGSSMRDDVAAGRQAAQDALVVVKRVEERLDRHLEHHAQT